MSQHRKWIVTRYKGHEIRLSVLRARRLLTAGHEWICAVTILRGRGKQASPAVVVTKEFSFVNAESEEAAVSTAFIDSLALCDEAIDRGGPALQGAV